jgi:hypothetical protein
MQYALSAINLADHNREEDAKKILNRCDTMMLQENFPYGMVSRSQQHNQIAGQFLLAAYKAGDLVLARKVSSSLRKDLEQQINYYNSLSEDRLAPLSYENDLVNNLLKQLQQMEEYFKNPQPALPNPEGGSAIIKNPPVIKGDTQVTDNKR